MAKKPPSNNTSTEGLVLVWGLLIVAFCMSGSFATGTGPVEFFLLGVSALFFFVVIGGFILTIAVTITHMFMSSRQDYDKSFTEVITDQYNWRAIKDTITFMIKELHDTFIEEFKTGPLEVARQRFLGKTPANQNDEENDEDEDDSEGHMSLYDEIKAELEEEERNKAK